MDEDYDEFEYNDAADDWEAEAAEEEAREKEVLEQKAFIEEQKLLKRVKAPVKKREQEEEETLAADISAALNVMKEEASSVGEARTLIKNDDASSAALIADMPAETEEEAKSLGEAIANRVLTFASSPHFNVMVAAIFQDLAHEFRTRDAANAEVSRVHVHAEEAKRQLKKAKKGKASNINDDGDIEETVTHKESSGGVMLRDALGFDAVDDRGGATNVAEEDENFMS